MVRDYVGFLYPKVDRSKCSECNLCMRACPALKDGEGLLPIEVYAAQCMDLEDLRRSSSGGLFLLLATKILSKGGVVYGVAWQNDFRGAHHIRVTDRESLAALLGSKYVQSDIGSCYTSVKNDLESGRHVLFSGTPCQIAGLKSYLKRDYEKLILVDVACHSVPSVKAWSRYLDSVIRQFGCIEDKLIDVNLRCKTSGWRDYSVYLSWGVKRIEENHRNNVFFKGFLNGLFVRRSCSYCLYKGGRSGADITLGDYWSCEGLHENLSDNRGTSVVFVNTGKGAKAFQDISGECKIEKSDYRYACNVNPALIHPMGTSKSCFLFMILSSFLSFDKAVLLLTSRNLFCRAANKIKKVFK